MLNPKKLLPIPVVLLILSLAIVYLNWTNGTVPMNVDLKGGSVFIVPTTNPVQGIEVRLKSELGLETTSRAVRDFQGDIKQQEIVINKENLSREEEKLINDLIVNVYESQGLEHGDVYSETVSGFFSEMFLSESIKAVVFAFLFMAAVIFIKFRAFTPSFAAVLSAFADIMETLAAMIILGVELSKGSIVALLLLIGYSVDTDIMLTSRLLKQGGRRELDITIKNSLYTGLTMVGSTGAAMIVLLLVSTSELLDSIATVIIIGLLFDILNTWITNLSLLIMYVERGGK